MKTTVEINGYLISIAEEEGRISVSAEKDGEIVEEFSIESEEGQDMPEGQDMAQEEEDIKGFDEFGQDEEEDFGDEMPSDDEEEGDDDDDEDDDDDDDDDNESALESFGKFIKKRK